MCGLSRFGASLLGVIALSVAACGGAPPSSPSGTTSHAPTSAASEVADTSPSPPPRFVEGDMLVVLAAVPIRDDRSINSPINHQLVPGDRVLVSLGPVPYQDRDWYEVGHRGFGGWVPAAEDGRALLAFDAPDPDARVLHLVKFGDSSTPGTDLWVLKIEERLGVEVRALDYFARAGGTGADILRLLKNDADVRAAVAEAEIVGIEINPSQTVTGDALGAVCTDNDPTPRDPPPVFTVEDFDEFADLWRQAYDEIFALRAGKPTMVRAFDMYVPIRDAWEAAGIEPGCTAGWEAFSGTVKLVAAEYGVPVASMYDALNGPKHDEDPVDKGYLDPAIDDKHLNERGRIAQIEVLDALGYAFVVR